jgi:hypothetical protein
MKNTNREMGSSSLNLFFGTAMKAVMFLEYEMTPFSEMYPYHTGYPMPARGVIVAVPHGLADVWQPLPYISPAYFGNSFTYI